MIRSTITKAAFIVLSISCAGIRAVDAIVVEPNGGGTGLPLQGLYDGCSRLDADCRAHLDTMATAGFKLVVTYGVFDFEVADIVGYADHAAAVGMKVIWDMSSRPYRDGTFTHQYIRERVDAVKTHPATWGYYVADEPPERERAMVKALGDYVHELDPAHPRLLVHWYEDADPVGTLRPHLDAADTIATDVYPAGTCLHSRVVGATAKAGQKLADQNGKQWAIVLQSFDRAQYPDQLAELPCPGWPDRERMLAERNLALENGDPAFILWYSYFDILRSSDPAARWADLLVAAFSPGPPVTMGMRIESVREESNAITVLTTGAKIVAERSGAVTFWQRIPRERMVLATRLSPTSLPFRVVRDGDFAVKLFFENFNLTIHTDNVVILILNQNIDAQFQSMITPQYNAENKGRRLLIDADGGFGIYPIRVSTPTSVAPPWRVDYSFLAGDEVWLSVIPPRPYNRQRSFESIAHEGTEYDPYPSTDVIRSDGKYTKVFTLHAYFWAAAEINVRSSPTRSARLVGVAPVGISGTLVEGPVEQYGDTIWWGVRYDNGLAGWTIEEFFEPPPAASTFRVGDRVKTRAASPWRATKHVPSNMVEFQRVRDEVHRNGMKFVVYVSPFYSEASDFLAEMRRVLNEYQVDGFYFDGIADDFRESYDLMRQARDIVGEERVLYVHDSLSAAWNGLVYFPFIDTYADYILRGELGRLGLNLQEFLRWTISGLNISNAVGYWVYYGSNIDDPSGGPECVYEGMNCCKDGNQVCYQNRVPTSAHIDAALENEARIWRNEQSWVDAGRGELARFDREYYGRLAERLYRLRRRLEGGR